MSESTTPPVPTDDSVPVRRRPSPRPRPYPTDDEIPSTTAESTPEFGPADAPVLEVKPEPETEPDQDVGAEGNRAPSRPWAALPTVRLVAAAVVIGLIAILSIVVVDRSSNYDGGDGISSAQRAALRSAKAGVTHLWSYDYRSFDSDLASALRYTTPAFRKEYESIATRVVKPTAVTSRVVAKSTVLDASVVSSTKSTVVLLIFGNQRATSSSASAVPIQISAKVTMQHVGGKWLIANVVSV